AEPIRRHRCQDLIESRQQDECKGSVPPRRCRRADRQTDGPVGTQSLLLVPTLMSFPLEKAKETLTPPARPIMGTPARPLTEAGRLLLPVSASFYKPYLPATSFNAGV